MSTTSQRFYPDTVEWDGTDPASGDVRTCQTVTPAVDNTSSCDFGTSGAKTITVDPYTAARTTTGLDSALGWAIDIAGSDGMDSTATAKRIMPAGAWAYSGTLIASPAIAIANCTVAMSVYRVAASPSTTRTLLFTDAGVAVVAVATTGTDFTRTTGAQSEVLLEPGETVQVTHTLTCTGQLGGLVIAFRTGGTAAKVWFDVPSPGVRTQYLETVTVTGVGTAVRQALTASHPVAVSGVGTVAVARQTTAARTVAVTGVGTVATARTITKTPVTVTGVGTVAGQVQIPFRLIPDTSDFSGSDPTFTLAGTIYNSTGAAVEGATVKLFRQSDDVKVATTTSAADGTYSFVRDSQDANTYYVISFEPGADPQTHGTSDRDLTPS